MHNKKQSRALNIVRKFFPNVDSVVDSLKDLDIEVTEKDVSASRRRKHSECAMAVACKRTEKVEGVIIATSTAYLIDGKKAIRYNVPKAVAREIVAFDRGAAFEPGDYSLLKIEPSRRFGVMTGGKGKDSGKRGTYRHRHLTENVRAVLGSEKAR